MKTPSIQPLRTNFPHFDRIEHPKDWEREHWSFDDKLRTRAAKSTAAEQTKRLLQKLLGERA